MDDNDPFHWGILFGIILLSIMAIIGIFIAGVVHEADLNRPPEMDFMNVE